MTNANVYEDIRSLLLSCPHGLTVREFLSDYKQMIGTDFPYRKHGYKTPEEFLTSIPDVVHVTYRAGERILTAVANEQTEHIQKLVANQKKSNKSSRNRRSNFSNFPFVSSSNFMTHYSTSRKFMPQRYTNSTYSKQKPFVAPQLEKYIVDLLKDIPRGIKIKDFNSCFCKKYGYLLDPSQHGFTNIEGLLFSLTNSVTIQNKGQYLVAVAKSTFPDTVNISKDLFNQIEEFTQQIQKGNENLTVSNNSTEVMCSTNKQEDINSSQTSPQSAEDKMRPDSPESFEKKDFLCDNIITINDTLKEELRKTVENVPEGLSCTLLPSRYRELTGKELDFHDLGFSNVMELVSSLPDVFAIERLQRYSPWLLFDARTDDSEKWKRKQSQNKILKEYDIKEIPPSLKRNIFALLQEFSHGVFLNEIQQKYKAKYKEDIPFSYYGFPSVKALILNLVNDVVTLHELDSDTLIVRLFPSAFDRYPSALPHDLDKSVKYKPINQVEEEKEYIPDDIVLPGAKFNVQDVDIATSSSPYIHVRISEVILGPVLFYVQLIGENTSEKLEDLMNDLEQSYSCVSAQDYKVHQQHLVKGLLCAVLYIDSNWHRGIILDIEQDKYKVCYIDYGTVETVTVDKIRYLKKKFFDFPAQAIRSRLANIRPANGEANWSKEACIRFFQLGVKEVGDLQAWIIKKTIDPITKEQELSLCLCDTSSGKKDIHINDVLVLEGFGILDNIDGFAPQFVNNPYPMSYYQAMYNNLPFLSYPCYFHPSYNSSKTNSTQATIQSQYNPFGYFNGYPLSGLSSQISWDSLLNSIMNSSGVVNPSNSSVQNSKVTVSECGPTKIIPSFSSEPDINRVTSTTTEPKEESSVEVDTTSVKMKSPDVKKNGPVDTFKSSNSDIDSNTASPHQAEEILEILSRELDNIPPPKRRCVKYVKLTNLYEAHVILFNNTLNMISSEISKFFPWKKDILRNMIRVRGLKIASIIVSENEEPELFEELKRYRLCDQKDVTQTLFPLDSVLKIIRDIADSSQKYTELIQAIMDEKMTFSPLNSYWGLEYDELLSKSSSGLDCFPDDKFEEFSLKILNNRRNLIESKLCEESNSNLQNELNFLNERINGLKT